MDLTSIELPGSKITDIKFVDDEIRIRFEPAYLIKTMTGSDERTKWRQNIELVFEKGELWSFQPCAVGEMLEKISIPIGTWCRFRWKAEVRQDVILA